MEERANNQNHKLMIGNRKMGTFTGVLDVLSFDIAEVLLETELGMLQIKGENLHVNRLNLEKGEVDIDGLFTSLEYSKVPGQLNKKTTLFERLFR